MAQSHAPPHRDTEYLDEDTIIEFSGNVCPEIADNGAEI